MSQYTSFGPLIQQHGGLHTGRFAIIGGVGGGAEAGLVGLFSFLACMMRHAMEYFMGAVIEIGGGTCPPRRRYERKNYSNSHGLKECDKCNQAEIQRTCVEHKLDEASN